MLGQMKRRAEQRRELQFDYWCAGAAHIRRSPIDWIILGPDLVACSVMRTAGDWTTLSYSFAREVL
jgi:hypothetical protein